MSGKENRRFDKVPVAGRRGHAPDSLVANGRVCRAVENQTSKLEHALNQRTT